MGSGKKRQIWKLYEVKDGKIIRKNKICPVCGSGTFLANHGDRLSCGKCGYTEYLKPKKRWELVEKLLNELKLVK